MQTMENCENKAAWVFFGEVKHQFLNLQLPKQKQKRYK